MNTRMPFSHDDQRFWIGYMARVRARQRVSSVATRCTALAAVQPSLCASKVAQTNSTAQTPARILIA